MAALTLDEMKTEIRAGLGDRTDYDTRLTLMLNMAQTRLARKHDFEELKVRDTFGTTAKTADPSADMVIALPSSTREIYSVSLIDGANSRKLVGRTNREWEQEIPYPEYYARGRPRIYKRWGTNIEVHPVPDAAYTLRGHRSKWPTDLSSASGVSDLKDKDDLLILLALIWVSILQDRADRANYFWSVFRSTYDDALKDDVHKPDTDKAPTTSQAPAGEYWLNPFVHSSQVE